MAHGEGAAAQGDWGGQIVVRGLAGTMLELCLRLPDRVIETIEQEIEERCQTVSLHLGDDLESGLTSIKFINNLHAGHIPLLETDGGQVMHLPWMTPHLVTRIYR